MITQSYRYIDEINLINKISKLLETNDGTKKCIIKQYQNHTIHALHLNYDKVTDEYGYYGSHVEQEIVVKLEPEDTYCSDDDLAKNVADAIKTQIANLNGENK